MMDNSSSVLRLQLGFLVAMPFVWIGAVFIAALLFYEQTGGIALVRTLQSPISEMLWAFGALSAAFRYGRKDYLWKAWFLFACGPLLYLMYDLGPWLASMGLPRTAVEWGQGLIVVCGNGLQVVAIVMFSRAWKLAGLDVPLSSKTQIVIRLIMLVVAVAAAGPGVVLAGMAWFSGDASAVLGLSSSLGDMFSLALMAPLFMTAFSLRGGVMSWPWIFMTGSLLGWLVGDIALTWLPYMGADARDIEIVIALAQSYGSVMYFSAGYAQRLVAVAIQERTSLNTRGTTQMLLDESG